MNTSAIDTSSRRCSRSSNTTDQGKSPPPTDGVNATGMGGGGSRAGVTSLTMCADTNGLSRPPWG
jgi:hypothetical protein